MSPDGNIKKRKSTGSLSTTAAKPAKKARHSLDATPAKPTRTLDTFFSPKPPIATSSVQGEGRLILSEEQKSILKMVVDEEKSVFFTGSAGTGKSLLLRSIIAALRVKYAKKPEFVSVTASTGMAASNIGGMTLHAWGAITPGLHNLDNLIKCIKTCRPAFQRWKTTKVLVIDEVSMVDAQLFETISSLADRLRKKSSKPFGGIQLVVTGDFFQLPPVTKSPANSSIPLFAFESAAWKSAIEHTVNLTQVFRQKDPLFVDILNELRRGTISPTAVTTFRSLSRSLSRPPSSLPLSQAAAVPDPTELFPLRTDVSRANAQRLAALPGELHAFAARDSGKAEPARRARLLETLMAGPTLALKAGAQVMLVRNVDREEGGRLVNGSVGCVLGFWRRGEVRGQTDTKGEGAIRRVKMCPDSDEPATAAEEKENTEFEAEGTLKGTKVKAEGTPKSRAAGRDEERYPLVYFPGADEVVLLVREEFRVEDAEGAVLARRMQVPLTLAWAMSIHKAQGQTIARVKIDLRRVFERGQSYVALSRAATLEGLQVVGFDPNKVKAHPKVLEWSKGLEEMVKA